MKISKKSKIELFTLLVILNIILRFQVIPREIGLDSFLMHIMTNSLSEFGYARWFLDTLSIFGLYPCSYTSSMQFLISGINQSTGMNMNSVIFLYCIFIGLLSMFTAYLMAAEIIDDDLFKLIVAFGFSTSPAVLGYTTWTIPTRGLLVILTPLLIYLLLRCRTSIKYIPLTILLAVLLFATHHLFYFIIPSFVSLFILIICFKLKKWVRSIKTPERLIPFILLIGFIFMLSIPFFTGKFIEHSRYTPIGINYMRYMGLMAIFAIGGLAYLTFKHDKRFGQWFLLLTLIFLTTFIYQQTYMKWFLPIFTIPLGGIGLVNVLKMLEKRKYALNIVVIFLLLTTSFSAYYQFLHNYRAGPYNERHIEDSTYNTGIWTRDYIDGHAISNDARFGDRISAVSGTTHILTTSGIVDQIYGFVSLDISMFKRYPLTSEDFWFSGYEGPAVGELAWESIHRLWKSPTEFNITYLVENTKTGGDILWHHNANYRSFIQLIYKESDCIYDCGKVKVWGLR